MRYFTKLRGQKEPVSVEIDQTADGAGGGGHYRITLDGKQHDVDALTLDHGAVSMLVDGRSFHVEFEEHGDDISVLIGSQVTRIDVADERRLRLRAGAAAFSVEGKQTVVAPMPGKLVKLLVKVGDEVKEHQGVCVVEAMKMENELKSPKAGKVTEIHAKEGATVEINAKLLTVE